MREKYGVKVHRLYREGKISYEQAIELLTEHRKNLDKRRKFKRGEVIKSFDELLEQTWVMWFKKTMHIKAVKCWQLSFVERAIAEGTLFKVEENKKIPEST